MHYQRGGAAYLDDLDALARVDHVVLVIAARGPDLAADAHAADTLAVGDALEHGGVAPDQRGRAGADRRRQTAMAAGERAQGEQHQQRRQQKDRNRQRHPDAGEADERGDERPHRERREKEPTGVHLSHAQHAAGAEPDDPSVHMLDSRTAWRCCRRALPRAYRNAAPPRAHAYARRPPKTEMSRGRPPTADPTPARVRARSPQDRTGADPPATRRPRSA